jgi:hypothetical protein
VKFTAAFMLRSSKAASSSSPLDRGRARAEALPGHSQRHSAVGPTSRRWSRPRHGQPHSWPLGLRQIDVVPTMRWPLARRGEEGGALRLR